jgi:hypothetical protein
MHTRLALSDRIPSLRHSVPKRSAALGLCRKGRAFRAASALALPIAFLTASQIFLLEPRFLAKEMHGDSFAVNFFKSAQSLLLSRPRF